MPLRVPSAAFAMLCCLTTALPADEHARWEFHDGPDGWTAMNQVELQARNGTLVVTSTGNDPHFSAEVTAPAGQHQLTLRARFEGRRNLQVFWTTDQDDGTSEAHSVSREMRSRDNEFHNYRVWFNTDAPLTSLRIDPHSSKGTTEFESIVLSDDAPPPPQATPVEDIRVPDGFSVELLYSVPSDDYGSWVAMTTDPKGRLIVSDQYGKLYRVVPPAVGKKADLQIDAIDVEVGMAQGLLCAFDSLYVNVNGTAAEKQGLYRITDSDGDDNYDSVEKILTHNGGGEHGPHAVILSPDGKSLYLCAGNHTNPPDYTSSRVPTNWQEDQLQPRMWDAGGHAVGKMAPGGWIARVSPDGSECELIATGFRNEYDIAFNPEGELFTYDADMEWDVGTPWYRPTRVCHVPSGAEFGWRSGTGKWPEWYSDSLPAALDIGPGSPTGIVFGTDAKFPTKYQQALFIADWSYGVIYAVHLSPHGSTWSGEAERFVAAAPLPVTDMIVHSDGALYFTIGGRRTQSGLYRVTYTGTDSMAAPDAVAHGSDLRTIRRELELLHRPDAVNAVEKAWPYLGHEDRFIRFVARVAIEHRPSAEWRKRVVDEPDHRTRLTALLALVRQAPPTFQEDIFRSLGTLPVGGMTVEDQLDVLRVLQLAMIRMGQPSQETRATLATILSMHFPTKDVRLNRELATLLCYLDGGQAPAAVVPLLNSAPTQEEQLHYALMLRTTTQGWTLDLREQYLDWFLQAGAHRGGHSFSGFIRNIRDDALATFSKEEMAALADLIARSPESSIPVMEASKREFVREWSVQDLLGDVESDLEDRDFENGRNMFRVTACYKCHRFNGQGGIVGPELTAVGRRFNARTMLESLIEPSKVISDQYEATMFLLDNGKQVIGRVVNLNNDNLMVSEDMLDPGNLTTIKRDEIEEMMTSKTSMMPRGLLNTLTRDDILDLVAYLRAGGQETNAALE